MYIIYIDADEKKITENGMTPEVFWRTIKVNLEDNKFMQLEDSHYYVNWEETASLGHCWALQSAFANDLPEFVESMTEYTLYEAGKFDEPRSKDEDEERFEYLKSFDKFSDDIAFQRNASYLRNMIKEVGHVKEKGKRKKKPVDFRRLDD